MAHLLRLVSACAAGALLGAGLQAVPHAQQPATPKPRPFSGLTTGVGDLPRLSKARPRAEPHAPFPALPSRDVLEIQ